MDPNGVRPERGTLKQDFREKNLTEKTRSGTHRVKGGRVRGAKPEKASKKG